LLPARGRVNAVSRLVLLKTVLSEPAVIETALLRLRSSPTPTVPVVGTVNDTVAVGLPVAMTVTEQTVLLGQVGFRLVMVLPVSLRKVI